MIIDRIAAKNFCSFKHIDVSPGTGVIGIFGRRDDSSERSNGTGKSTLLEIVNFALFGRSQRGTVTDLYSNFGEGDMVVELGFHIADRKYVVYRTWNQKS